MRTVITILALYLMTIFGIDRVEAKTTFLPDWQGAGIETKRWDKDSSYDEPMCRRAGIYHKATGCPAPKVFDEYCPFDNKWISECYCPDIFSYSCPSPYRGDNRVDDPSSGFSSCDGLWVACCDTTCPSGTSPVDPGGCGGYTYNDCGDVCYYPYVECCYPSSDETGCSCGTYECSDGCGGTRTCCSTCPEPEETTPEDSSSSSGGGNDTCTPSADETGCSYGTENCDDGCGGTRKCCAACSPAADATGCEYGTEDCDDGCGGTRKCCKSAPDCTPSADETGCDYGTEDCDDGCGGTRKCCKACTPSADETGCSYGTEDCGDGCGGTRKCCKSCTPSADETGCTNGTETCDDGCGGTRKCCKACLGSSTCTGSTTACSSNQIKTNECTDCSGTTRYTCEERKCNDSGSYDGSSCSQYSSWAGECMGGYQMKYTSCVGSGNTPGHGNGDCDVDSWNRCCEQCTGEGPAGI